MDPDELPYIEDDPDGNEYYNIKEFVPHVPVPQEVIKAIRSDLIACDDGYYFKHVMFLSLIYGHMTAGTPLPSVLHPNMDKQNPNSDPFDFRQ